MAKWLVKLSKKPWINFLIIIGLFLTYEINRKYIGLDFSNDVLEKVFNFYPLVLIGLLFLNMSISSHYKRLYLFQIIILFSLGIFYLTSFLVQAKQELVQRIDLSAEATVEEIRSGDQSYLLSERQWAPFLLKKKCVYSFFTGLGGELTALTPQSLSFEWRFKNTSEEVIINIGETHFLDEVYSCENTQEDIDPYGDVLKFWGNILSIPSNVKKYTP